MLKRIKAFATGLQFRFLLLVCGLGIALPAALLVSELASAWRISLDGRLTEARQLSDSLVGDLASLPSGDARSVKAVLAAMASRPNILSAELIDSTKGGGASDGDVAGAGGTAASVGNGDRSRRKVTVRRQSIEVQAPVENAGGLLGVARIDVRKPAFLAVAAPIVGEKLIVILPIMITAVLFTIGMVGSVTASLARLSTGAAAVSRGEITELANLRGFREIREFGNAFNGMQQRLREDMSQIYELAYMDRITRLPNREFLQKELSDAICRAQRKGTAGALLFVDLDGFKKVNDTLGHELGDQLLAAFAERVAKIIRADDAISWNASEGPSTGREVGERKMLARLGGDEFTILLREIREETDAAKVAQRIISAMERPFEVGGKLLRLGASLGIATFPHDGSTHEELLRNADMAMYLAKEEGRNTYRFYSRKLNERARSRMQIENDLRVALERDELVLHYQPKLTCDTRQVVAAEALIRWHHPGKGMVRPGEFLSIANDSGLILPLGDWILDRACRDHTELAKNGIDVPISVNIASQQFDRIDFCERTFATLERRNVKADRIVFEITEGMVMSNPERAPDHIRRLSAAGIGVSIDDFGTGYSNMSLLTRLPFDEIKIDRSFVANLCDDDGSQAGTIVRMIISMARSLGLNTIAEGVETEEQFKLLQEAGCTFAQGYLFARPMPLDELIRWTGSMPRKNAARRNSGTCAA